METLKSLSPVDWILRAPVGSAAYARFREGSGQEMTCFVIHEDTKHVRKLPKEVSIDVRGTMFERSGVSLVVVMLRIEGEIYETWWNFHNPELRSCFEDMSTQEKLLVSFYVDSPQPARTIWIPNPLGSGFGPLMKAMTSMMPWTMDAFDRAKAELSEEYPTPQTLWDGMVA